MKKSTFALLTAIFLSSAAPLASGASDETLVMELKFPAAQATLAPDAERGLESFLRAASFRGRIEEIHLIAWVAEGGPENMRALASDRLVQLKELLSPYAEEINVIIFESSEASQVQGSVLVELEN